MTSDFDDFMMMGPMVSSSFAPIRIRKPQLTEEQKKILDDEWKEQYEAEVDYLIMSKDLRMMLCTGALGKLFDLSDYPYYTSFTPAQLARRKLAKIMEDQDSYLKASSHE